MPARPLILWPDPRLRRACARVETFDDDLRALAADLTASLDAAMAAGLTAAHVGELRRLVVLRPEPGGPASVYCNPEVVEAAPERAAGREGSVSMPGVADDVERAAWVRVRFQDLDGVGQEERAEGFRAACLQHEIDQLDGVFWIERLSRLRRERILKRFAKLRDAG